MATPTADDRAQTRAVDAKQTVPRGMARTSRRAASRTLPLAVLATIMIVAGLAIVIYQGMNAGTSGPQSAQPTPGVPVADLLSDQEESGTGMVIQIADKDDPTRLAAEILADRYDPEGPTIRLVQMPKAWLFGEDGSAWLIEADRGRFYIPEGEDNPREGTLTGNVIARRYEPEEDFTGARPTPNVDTPALTATTDEPLRFNLDLLTFETDGLLEIDTDALQFKGRGAFVVLNEQRGSITRLRVDRGERIVFTPQPEPEPDATSKTVKNESDTQSDASPDTIALAEQSPVPSAASATATTTPEPPKIDFYKVIISENVKGVNGGRTIDSDLLTVWARLIDNQLPEGPIRSSTATARSPFEAMMFAVLAAQSGIQPGPAQIAETAEAEQTALAEDETEASTPVEEAAAIPDPVTLTWDGPLTVEPLTDAPNQLTMGDNLAMRFEATDGDVNIRDASSDATAKALAATYFSQRERVVLEGSGGSVVLASPAAGRIEGMNAVEIELAAGIVTIPTAGELFGKEHAGDGPSPVPQTMAWSEAASFVFTVADGRMTDRLERAGFRGRVRGANRDATIDGDTLLALFDTPLGGSPRLLQLNVEGALAEDGRGGSVGGEGMEVHFARGTFGEDIDPTRALLSGDAFAQRDGRETIRGQWIDADLARNDEGNVIVTRAEARGDVEFEDGIGISGQGDALIAEVLEQTATITSNTSNAGEPAGDLAWVSKDGTRVSGPDIRLDSQARTIEVWGPGAFSHAGTGGADSTIDDGGRPINATWTGRMEFDDAAGTVLCLGNVQAESPGPDGSIDTVTGDRLEITMTPNDADNNADLASGADSGDDRLQFAEVFGSADKPARIESRRFAAQTPAGEAPSDSTGESSAPGVEPRTIEELFRLDGAKIRFGARDNRIDVPTAGRFFVLDRRPEIAAAEPTPGADAPSTDSPLSAPDGRRGTTLVTWDGSMEFDRGVGRAVFRENARFANKPIDATDLSDVIANEITASFQPAAGDNSNTGDLRWAIATGDALLRIENRREILGDRLIYNPERGRIEALAESPRRVEITDLSRGTTTTARAVRWDLASDRIDIINPGSIISPE